ncbi:ATP-dependent RNA helicase DRS1 [Diplonema papillatum]|nr:ATP-dependent RNA helicase DRS1 [Diplonema papillatum]
MNKVGGFFAGLAGPGRGFSINPADRKKRAANDKDDDEDSWEDTESGGNESEDEAHLALDVSDASDDDDEDVAAPGEEADAADEEEEAEHEEDEENEEAEEEEEEETAAATPAKPVKPAKPAGEGAYDGARTVKIAEGQQQDKTSWFDLPLSKQLNHAVATCGWVMPTPVQCKAIPAAVDGYDVCCRAVTGSGKTGTFLIPILQRVTTQKRAKACIRAVALLPTRELAVQCMNMLDQLSEGMGVSKSLVIGGLSVPAQQRELRNRPEVVIATPGRLIDALRNAAGVSLDGLEMLVLDEADRLLSHGFRPQIEELLRFCPPKRQTLLLSATMTREVNELAALALEKPLNVDVGHVAVAANLTQEFIRLPADLEERARMWYLTCLIQKEFRRGVIVFCEKKTRAMRVRILLDLLGVSCAELHQSVSQEERLAALDRFRNREVRVLVTTEVASRGLDIEGVRTVINYDMPCDITGYVHRVGRTARIGNTGRSVAFVGAANLDLMKKIVKLSKAQINSTQTSKVRQRTVDDDRLKDAERTVDSLQPKIRERMELAITGRELEDAEKQVNKQQNTLLHMDEIRARPKPTWFSSEADKKENKKRSREDADQAAARDLSEYEMGSSFHAIARKQGEFGAKRARLEAMAEKSTEAAPKSDKYGKIYVPHEIIKHRGKSLRKANKGEYMAKRREAKAKKMDQAATRLKKTGKKSGKDKKKDWKFTERKGTFKSKKRYKRH